jgi:hypothetical protein
MLEYFSSPKVQAGGIFPTEEFGTILKTKLRESRFDSDEFIEGMKTYFDEKTKHTFLSADDGPVYVPVGSIGANDRAYGIWHGRLTLQGLARFSLLFSPLVADSSPLLTEPRSRRLFNDLSFSSWSVWTARLRIIPSGYVLPPSSLQQYRPADLPF